MKCTDDTVSIRMTTYFAEYAERHETDVDAMEVEMTNLPEGENTLTLWSRDEAGNRSEVVSHTLNVDTQAPVDPQVIDPPNEALLTTNTLCFHWNSRIRDNYIGDRCSRKYAVPKCYLSRNCLDVPTCICPFRRFKSASVYRNR